MEKAIFPMKYYNLTQGYFNSTTHKGTYALDNAGKDTGKDEIYAPFSCKVTKLYVKAGHAYTVWLTSLNKVLCANGKQEYLTLMIVHPEDIANLKVGQTFSQGQLVCHEGKTGNATGNHAHLELGIGTCGWHQNSYKTWMIDNPVKLEEYMVLRSDSVVMNDIYKGNRYSFKKEDEVQTPTEPSTNDSLGIKYATSDLNVRTGAGTNYKAVNVIYKKTAVRVHEIKGSWARIEEGMWVSNNYLTSTQPSGHYKSMEVTNCTNLNVRKTPNGAIVRTIPNHCVVSVLETKGNWVRIGSNQWVYKQYLK